MLFTIDDEERAMQVHRERIEQEAREKGLEEGRAQGRAEGRAEGVSDVIELLRANGASEELIAQAKTLAE